MRNYIGVDWADEEDAVWVVNDAGAICHRVGNQWTYPPGAAHDVVGALLGIGWRFGDESQHSVAPHV